MLLSTTTLFGQYLVQTERVRRNRLSCTDGSQGDDSIQSATPAELLKWLIASLVVFCR